MSITEGKLPVKDVVQRFGFHLNELQLDQLIDETDIDPETVVHVTFIRHLAFRLGVKMPGLVSSDVKPWLPEITRWLKLNEPVLTVVSSVIMGELVSKHAFDVDCEVDVNGRRVIISVTTLTTMH